jgi:hypothetical protein
MVTAQQPSIQEVQERVNEKCKKLLTCVQENGKFLSAPQLDVIGLSLCCLGFEMTERGLRIPQDFNDALLLLAELRMGRDE